MTTVMKHFLIILCILIGLVILIISINYLWQSSHDPEECEIKLYYTGIYNGHSYLYFSNSHSWIHDPDCKKCLDSNPWKNIVFPKVEEHVPYMHGIPAPRNSNDPPWVYTEYPVGVIEGLTPEETQKYFLGSSIPETTNIIEVTTNYDALDDMKYDGLTEKQWNELGVYIKPNFFDRYEYYYP